MQAFPSILTVSLETGLWVSQLISTPGLGFLASADFAKVYALKRRRRISDQKGLGRIGLSVDNTVVVVAFAHFTGRLEADRFPVRRARLGITGFRTFHRCSEDPRYR